VTLRVAVYAGPGAIGMCASAAQENAARIWGHESALLGPEELSLSLDGYDVVVFPGGGGSRQGRALGAAGREQVQSFVKRGGGYLGLCAGAFLATRSRSDYLGLLPLRRVSPWQRGTGEVLLRCNPKSPAGKRVLSEEVGVMHYVNGPVLQAMRDDDTLAIDPWASFVSDLDGRGDMPGSWAVVAGSYGQGRVLLFSPHPELTTTGPYQGKRILGPALEWLSGAVDGGEGT
jgi:putative intracellular protease/amidase